MSSGLQGPNKSMRRHLLALEQSVVQDAHRRLGENDGVYDAVARGVSAKITREYGDDAGRVAAGFLGEAKGPFFAEMQRRELARAEALRERFRASREDLAGGASPSKVQMDLLELAQSELELESEYQFWLDEQMGSLVERLWNRIKDITAASWEALKATVEVWWRRLMDFLRLKPVQVPLFDV